MTTHTTTDRPTSAHADRTTVPRSSAAGRAGRADCRGGRGPRAGAVDEDLLEGVLGEPETVREVLASGNRDIRSAAAALRGALDELHRSRDRAWKAYADEVDRALVHLDAELQVAAAQLRAERTRSGEGIGAALHEVTDSWRAHVDDAKVQARLAEMEARDLRLAGAGPAPLRASVDRAVHGLRSGISSVVGQTRDDAAAVVERFGRLLPWAAPEAPTAT